MSTMESEPRPGTAFNAIVQEQEMLDQFMAIVERKMDADKRHLDDLIELRKTWNPKWGDTSVGTLISPILNYFTNEITHLAAARDEMLARFKAIPEPDGNKDALEIWDPGWNAFRRYPCDHLDADLEGVYLRCEELRKDNLTAEAQETFVDAKKSLKMLCQDDGPVLPPLGTLLPLIDRTYRIAVNRQHQVILAVVEWYDKGLGRIVERHQQRVEDIKAFLLGCCGSLGKLASDLSASCSSALHFNQAFTSTRFIAPRYDEIERERSHFLLRKFEYHNFVDGRIGEPIFGLGPQRTLRLAKQTLDAITGTSPMLAPGIDWIFDLEERTLADHALDVTTVRPNQHDLFLLLQFTLWSDGPLFPISSHYFQEHANTVPRNKLSQILSLINGELRGQVMIFLAQLMSKIGRKTYYGDVMGACDMVARLLCHTGDAKTAISQIWRKWDFERDCPLPDGVTRRMTFPEAKVWTKTGIPYSG